MLIHDSLVAKEADVISDIALGADAGLIVIASRGRGPFTGAVLGSVTQRLLHVASCPVLVVPAAYEAPVATGPATSTAGV